MLQALLVHHKCTDACLQHYMGNRYMHAKSIGNVKSWTTGQTNKAMVVQVICLYGPAEEHCSSHGTYLGYDNGSVIEPDIRSGGRPRVDSSLLQRDAAGRTAPGT